MLVLIKKNAVFLAKIEWIIKRGFIYMNILPF